MRVTECVTRNARYSESASIVGMARKRVKASSAALVIAGGGIAAAFPVERQTDAKKRGAPGNEKIRTF